MGLINLLSSRLGEPAFERFGTALFETDAEQLLAALPDASVRLVLTSPPYNIGKPYESVRPIDNYVSWLISWMHELHRVVTDDGSVWINLGYLAVPGQGAAVPIPYLLWPSLPFFLMQEVVWHYSAGVACRRRLSPRNEKLLWLVKDPNRHVFDLDAIRDPDVRYPNQRKGGRLRCNPLGKNPSDVWVIPKVTAGRARSSPERQPHPAQMPLALALRVVAGWSEVGDLVLDPFAGSATTLVAAASAERRGLGSESSREYAAVATARLDASLTANVVAAATAAHKRPN